VLAGALACQRDPVPNLAIPIPELNTPQPAPSVSQPSPNRPTRTFESKTRRVDPVSAQTAHALIQGRMFGGPLPETPLVHFTPIEDPSGEALRPFYDALDEILSNRNGTVTDAQPRKVRIAFYGSSSVAADRYTGYLRGYLQHRFGDGGVGFVSLVPLSAWHRHTELALSASKQWVVEHTLPNKRTQLDGRYGLLGASARSSRRSTYTQLLPTRGANTDPSNSDTIELHYLRQPRGGHFDLLGPQGTPYAIDTRADSFGLGLFEAPDPHRLFPMTVRVHGDGEVRLFGAVLERNSHGVVLDELGVGGSRAADLLTWTEDLWLGPLERRNPALFVLAYGANEAMDVDEPIEVYRDNLLAVLDKFERATPTAACVLVGPADFRLEQDRMWVSRPRIDAIIKVQRSVAFARGCGFFDTRAFAGGDGSMNAWVTADPPLAKVDHLHLTTLGYLYMGRTFADALMAGYDSP